MGYKEKKISGCTTEYMVLFPQIIPCFFKDNFLISIVKKCILWKLKNYEIKITVIVTLAKLN